MDVVFEILLWCINFLLLLIGMILHVIGNIAKIERDHKRALFREELAKRIKDKEIEDEEEA